MTDNQRHEYLNNEILYAEICKWKKQCARTGTIVKPNDIIGKAIMLVSIGLSKKHNFSGYTPAWKEEMIGFAIETCVKGLPSFDETKYKNVHAFLTMCAFNAMIQIIKRERKQTAVKYAYFAHNVYDSRDEEMTSICDEAFIQDIYDKMNQYESSVKGKNKDDESLDETTLDALDFMYEEPPKKERSKSKAEQFLEE